MQERDEARAASETRATFITTLSHELREPMNGVLGMARLLGDTPLDPEQREFLAALLEAGESLLSIINDIIDLSRIDAGRLELLEVDVELRPFLDRLRRALKPRAAQKGLALEFVTEASTPASVRTDPGRLRQILTSLLGNALRFTEQGGIRLEAGGREDRAGRVGLRLVVADTGPGIPPEALSRLFTPFAQGGPEIRRLYGGSGLGLMIAKRLTEALGGSIGVASSPTGTAFTIELDLPSPERTADPGARPATSLADLAALVVDGQPRTRRTTIELLQRWGMVARGARTGGQALTLLAEAADRVAPYDLVITDQTLPDLTGEALSLRIRDDPRLARPHLVLLVGAGLRGDAARARAAGFAAYLPKPVQASSLLQCLMRLRAGDAAPGGLITHHQLAERRMQRLDILVADDNAMNRRLLSIMLERDGHRVGLAEDGAAALSALATRPFDLVLMDVRMPGLDGLEATARIRALEDRRVAAVPIVAVTANAMQGDAERCLRAGMDGYVAKPIDAATLNAAISDAVEARAAANRPA